MNIQATRTQTNVPIGVHIARDVGVTGLTVVARIFNGANLSQFLDFNDGLFKDAGHTTPTTPLAEVQATANPGYYAIDGGFDLSAITVPPTASSLVVQYEITAGGENGHAVDVIQFAAELVDDVLSSVHGAGSWATAVGFATPADVAAATAAIIAQGDAAWITAVGFATPGDAMTLTAAERAAIDAVLAGTHGAGSWQGGASLGARLDEVWTSLGLNIAAPASFDASAGFIQALAAGIDVAITVVGTTVTLTRQP